MNEEHIIAGTDPPPKMKEEATPQAVRRETAISALLSAARELVAKYGVAGATLARIGEKAGYSRGLVAHYFGTKEKLIEALIWDQRATYIRLLQQLEAENGLEKLIQAIAVYVDAGANLQTYGRAYFVLRATVYPETHPDTDVADYDRDTREMFATFVRQGQVDGSIRPDVSAEEVAWCFRGLGLGIADQLYVSPYDGDIGELKAHLSGMLRNWLAPPGR